MIFENKNKDGIYYIKTKDKRFKKLDVEESKSNTFCWLFRYWERIQINEIYILIATVNIAMKLNSILRLWYKVKPKLFLTIKIIRIYP